MVSDLWELSEVIWRAAGIEEEAPEQTNAQNPLVSVFESVFPLGVPPHLQYDSTAKKLVPL